MESVQLVCNGISDKIVNKYSKVERRRISISISLLGDPKVCLDYLCRIYVTVKKSLDQYIIYLFKVVYMDEPNVGLDWISRKKHME